MSRTAAGLVRISASVHHIMFFLLTSTDPGTKRIVIPEIMIMR